ncbi:MAG: NAD(P)/FAD-dependent oxidoreductase [Marinilabiliales bacterium]|nr:MAG: NAD(P)/FAD-dependent oxidoreductase [Marinilabiliales bacterium]
MQKNHYNTIIVGGGIAGLTAAAYVARDNKQVLLIEKNKECGGLVNSFKHKGFQFEAGVRALEDAGIIIPMLQDLGIELEFKKSPVTVGIGKDVLHIKDKNSLNDYGSLLKKHYPESEDEIDEIIKIIRKIMKHMDVLYGVANPFFKYLKKDFKFIFTELLPWLPKFAFTIGKINKINMPVEDYLETVISNQSLRDIISQHFFRQTPTFFALSYFSLYLDYQYPVKGVGSLADAVYEKVLDLGGEVKTETIITQVNASEQWVKDEQNNIYYYDNLIWAADLKYFYSNTDIKGLSADIQSKFNAEKTQMLSKRGGDSVYSLFIEVDEPLESFEKITSGHFFYSPSSKGLGTLHTSDLTQLIQNWDNISKKELYDWLDKFTELNTYEISIPGLKNADFVPQGKTGIIISFLTDYDLFQKLKEKNWYEEFRKELEARIVNVITNSIYPMLKEKLMDSFSFTPLSIHNRVGSSEGAIVGWSFQESVPVPNKIQDTQKSVVSSIPNIFKAGQWTYSPAGVPMSILTGKLAADKVCKL